MPYAISWDDKEYRVTLKNLSSSVFEVTLEELDENGNVTASRKYTVDVTTKDYENFSVIDEYGMSYEVDIEDKGEGNFEVFVNGEHFGFNLMDEFRKKMEKLLHGDKLALASGEVRTSMPGKVTKIFVSEGDIVKKDQPLLTIEAMKMENEFRAPKDGVVRSLKVKVGDIVNTGSLLVVVE